MASLDETVFSHSFGVSSLHPVPVPKVNVFLPSKGPN